MLIAYCTSLSNEIDSFIQFEHRSTKMEARDTKAAPLVRPNDKQELGSLSTCIGVLNHEHRPCGCQQR